MPVFEVMFPKLNSAVRDDAMLAQAKTMLGDRVDLRRLLETLDVLVNADHADFVESTPASIQAAILEVVRENLGRNEPKQMQFMWTPGYDWELRIVESQSSIMSDGGITIHVKSRYPGDPHPGTGS